LEAEIRNWQESFFDKNLNSKSVNSSPLSHQRMQINVQNKHQRMQNECAELIPVMEKAVLKQQNEPFGKGMCCWGIEGQSIPVFAMQPKFWFLNYR
jgi:hypothetical protein